MGVTSKNYNGLQKAYAFFNRRLFDGELPEVLITLRTAGKARGYFWGDQFTHRHEASSIDEIALNPDVFAQRTDGEILSTLAHEMCHVWQHHFGTPSRAGYHNAEWGDKMDSIGLTPSSTGEPGGKRTGQQMSHVIVGGGAYQLAFKRLVSQRDWKLDWQTRIQDEDGGDGAEPGEGTSTKPKGTSTKPKAISKVKFTCPVCGQNAWAKPSAVLICGVCYADTEEITSMLTAD